MPLIGPGGFGQCTCLLPSTRIASPSKIKLTHDYYTIPCNFGNSKQKTFPLLIAS